MTKKQVWRYRCGFCKKAGLRGFWIQKHETGCTANPDRTCGLCVHADKQQRPIVELLACVSTEKEQYGLSELRTLTEDCPACILAAIRQSGILKWDGDPGHPPRHLDFVFKDELARFWEARNESGAR